jgi:hypothetical protein
MKKMKIYLDYQCYPIWVYDDNGDLICNDLPEELIKDKQLDETFVKIQNIYDNLFVDDSIEFKYIGFSNKEDREEFLKLIDNEVNKLKTKISDLYIFEEKIEI